MIGNTISHYKILEKLGEGGMGVVYKALDTKLDRFVALKFLPPHLGKSKEEKDRFIHEAKAASALQHSNICTIHEIDENDDGQMFICMDYYEGQTLDQKIKQGPLPLEEAVDIAIQISNGLDKAHKKEIVHRDIKPGNILLTHDHVVKILDFGLAKLRGRTKLTKAQTTLGTVAYMSPEQSQGKKVDHRSDIWSLGVVLYEMITGRRPFKGDYDQAMIYSIMNEEPEPLTGLRTGVPLELEKIINKILTKNPDERYQHINELVVDLKRMAKELKSGTMKQPATSAIPEPKKKKYVIGAIAGLTIFLVVFYFLFLKESQTFDRKSVAVLPFDNLSDDKANEYFSDGITEDVIAHLSKIGDLKVISRTSIMLYKDRNKSIREIGRELRVATVLEGSVRRAGDRVRIVSQLIDAKTDKHLWAETYDRKLEDIFAIQSDVAQKIAIALEAKLSAEERGRIEQKPTENLKAYDFYLQGREYVGRSAAKKEIEISIDLFEKAVREDPDFAEAYAGLSMQHGRMRWWNYDTSPERFNRAREAVDKALSLKPGNPLVREANGYYHYWRYRDYARALDEFSYAQRKEPGNASFYTNIAFIQRRLGKHEDAVENLKIAFQLDPRSSFIAQELAGTYLHVRMYEEMEHYLDDAISIAPTAVLNHIYKAESYLYKTGNTESARQVLEEALKLVDSVNLITLYLIYMDIYDGQYQDALDRLISSREEGFVTRKKYKLKEAILGFIYKQMGQLDMARTQYKAARNLLESQSSDWPDNPLIHAELGIVYAHLGLKNEAIREGQTAVDLMPVSRDALDGPDYLGFLAEIYTIVGEYEKAIAQLEFLSEIPAGWMAGHIGLMKVNPVWDPLRDHPRFQKLLERRPLDLSSTKSLFTEKALPNTGPFSLKTMVGAVGFESS